MDPLETLKGFDVESVKRLRVTHGLFDVLALSARYNYTFDEYKEGMAKVGAQPETPEVVKTVFHELTHLYQMLSTPYGYYYYSLKGFQNNQVVALMRMLREEYDTKIQFPLVNLIAKFEPKEKYVQLWGNLYLWYLAEMLLLYLEGDVDIFLHQMVHNPLVSAKPVLAFFAEMEFYLTKYYATSGRPLTYNGPNLAFTDDNFAQEKLLIALKATGDTDVMALLESGAKVAEYWGSGIEETPNFRDLFPSSMSASQIKYYFATSIVKDRLPASNIREFVLAYTALCELALFAPLLPHHYTLRNPQTTIKDLHPFFRFMDASSAAAKVAPIRRLDTDYPRFMTEVCAQTGWPTPQEVASRTLAAFEFQEVDRISFLFHAAQKFRSYAPWVFADYSVWFTPKNEFTAPFTYFFIHPILEFKDKILFHKDKELVHYFVLQYILQNYLRRVLISKDLTVTLPYKALDDEIALLQEDLAVYLDMALGIKNAKITLKAGEAA